MKPTELEIKAISAIGDLLENKYTLIPQDITIHGQGYLFEFRISNGDEYFVKVYDDNSLPKVYKCIQK